MKHLEQSIRVAIDENNISIQRDESKCVKCGECARICSKYESVNNNYKLSNSKQPICVNCGQCVKVCPTNCITAKNEYSLVKEQINDQSKIFIASVSPAVRVALGDEFGLKRGSFVAGKVVALLKQLGFKYVLDTNFSADLTICQEAHELQARLNSKTSTMPMFTSCCPAWVKYVETFYPEFIPNLSTCKSPIAMQGALVKTYFAKMQKISPSKIVHVVITPCTAKKYEIRRPEFNASAQINNEPMRDSDFCLTTVELAKWATEKDINFDSLQPQEFTSLMGQSSGGGVIFGNSGGVMESAIRTAYYYITGNEPPAELLNFKAIRGLKGIKEADVQIGNKTLKVASVSGLTNARSILKRLKAGKKYDFIEVMACPAGCVGGGGQPKHLGDEIRTQKSRASALYDKDEKMSTRCAHQNSQIEQLYKNYLTPNINHILHTHYTNKSGMLGSAYFPCKNSKNKVVTICGSMKYQQQIIAFAQKLECEKGYCVLQCVYDENNEKLSKKELNNITLAHYKKIDISDIIYVVNVDNYIENSTKNEIEYAKNKGKKIIYYQ